MSAAWQGNWKKRIISRLQLLAYSTLTAYLRNNQAIPYLVVADILGKDDVAAFKLDGYITRRPSPKENCEKLQWIPLCGILRRTSLTVGKKSLQVTLKHLGSIRIG